jgi:transcription antitermination factor NusA-like protein
LDSVDENIGSYALDDRTDAEVSNFTKFLYDIATKGPWEEADLMFTGHLFRISVILVAKKETLDVAGLRAHFDRVRLVATEGVDRIYIRGIGRENILNVKRLINLLKGIPHLNKIREKRYMVEDISGKRRTLLMAVYENYYEKGLEQEEQEAEEIVELLSAHIPEVDNGSIEVVKVAREKGIMTKVLLRTNFEHIHVVACCIGSNFERKNKIESKLVEENIYFVEDSDDVKTLIGRALCPFRMEDIESTRIRTRDKSAIVVVDDGKIGAAIGKLGINVKLASQLVGWKIKIIESSDSQ